MKRTETETKRAMLYTRLSLADRLPDGTPDTESVERQERACRAYAERAGWVVSEEVARDNDVSASRYAQKARPGYARVIEAMKNREVDAVIVQHTDRLTRRPREVEDLIDLVERTGVRVAAVEGALDLTDGDGIAHARVAVAFAAQQSDSTSRRMKSQRKDRAERGTPVRAIPGFGWDKNGPVEVEANAIADAARRVVAGESLSSIARRWNAEGLKRRKTDAAWRPGDVRVVLLQPRHRGIATHRGVEVGALRDGSPAIIDPTTADALLAMFASKATTKARVGRSLLTGLVICGRCGRTMRRSVNHGVAHRCECKLSIATEPVEALVEEAILAVFAKGVPESAEPPVSEEVASALAALKAREEMVGAAVASGAITMGIAVSASKDIEAERSRLLASIRKTARDAALDRWRQPGALAAAWPTMEPSSRNAVAKAVIDRVEVAPTAPGVSGLKRITVVWRA